MAFYEDTESEISFNNRKKELHTLYGEFRSILDGFLTESLGIPNKYDRTSDYSNKSHDNFQIEDIVNQILDMKSELRLIYHQVTFHTFDHKQELENTIQSLMRILENLLQRAKKLIV